MTTHAAATAIVAVVAANQLRLSVTILAATNESTPQKRIVAAWRTSIARATGR